MRRGCRAAGSDAGGGIAARVGVTWLAAGDCALRWPRIAFATVCCSSAARIDEIAVRRSVTLRATERLRRIWIFVN